MLNEISRGFGVRKKDVVHLLSESDYIPPLNASEYVNRLSLQLNLPDNTKDCALHLVEDAEFRITVSLFYQMGLGYYLLLL
jgi:transcription initiation factor TFIIIB Brf1 subunit/transcription initiation factor TFIIB